MENSKFVEKLAFKIIEKNKREMEWGSANPKKYSDIIDRKISLGIANKSVPDSSNDMLNCEYSYNRVASLRAFRVLPFLELISEHEVRSRKKTKDRYNQVSSQLPFFEPLSDALICDLNDLASRVGEKVYEMFGSQNEGFYAHMLTSSEKTMIRRNIEPILKGKSGQFRATGLDYAQIPSYLPQVGNDGQIIGKKVPVGPYFVDILCFKNKIKMKSSKCYFIAFEVDGDVHSNSKAKQRKDLEMTKVFEMLGIHVVRIDNEQVCKDQNFLNHVIGNLLTDRSQDTPRKPTKPQTVVNNFRKICLFNIATWFSIEELPDIIESLGYPQIDIESIMAWYLSSPRMPRKLRPLKKMIKLAKKKGRGERNWNSFLGQVLERAG